DQISEMENAEKETVVSHQMAMSNLYSKLNEETKRTAEAQNKLTTAEMRCVVLEAELKNVPRIEHEELSKISGSGLPQRPKALTPLVNDVDAVNKLKTEKDKLSKEKSRLIQELIEARKNIPELEKLKREKEEDGEEM
ncbi:hypothetical protein PMAYCL1PPCAC_25919, partial [Pristionchus mayeri]